MSVCSSQPLRSSLSRGRPLALSPAISTRRQTRTVKDVGPTPSSLRPGPSLLATAAPAGTSASAKGLQPYRPTAHRSQLPNAAAGTSLRTAGRCRERVCQLSSSAHWSQLQATPASLHQRTQQQLLPK